MSAVRVVVASTSFLIGWAVLAADGRAQGFFQSLFGFGSVAPAPAPAPAVAQPAVPPSYRAPVIPPPRPRAAEDHSDAHLPLHGNYRTVCVRLCDGYYFPISSSVSRRAFGRDAGLCRASCGKEAVLFVSPTSSSDASNLIDLTGRAYARLPNAFRYRKTLVEGCKCKPEPWAQSEIERHRTYAAEVAAAKAGEAPAADAAPANAPTAASDATSSSPSLQVEPAEFRAPPRPDRQRESAGNIARKVAAKPHPAPVAAQAQHMPKPVESTPFGLGGSNLRWPGD